MPAAARQDRLPNYNRHSVAIMLQAALLGKRECQPTVAREDALLLFIGGTSAPWRTLAKVVR
jgi:hypothetical protein